MNTLTTFKQKKAAQGFTLIELMIAIAIVGVLAAVAVPQFTDYLGRARVSEAVNLAQGCKTGFVEFNATQGGFPTSAADSGCSNVVTDNVASVAVASGAITVTLKGTDTPLPPAVRGHRIILQPLAPPPATGPNVVAVATAGGPIAGWRCSVAAASANANAAAKAMVPTACKLDPLP